MTLLYSFGAMYLLWIFYLAVMNLKRARDNGALTNIATLLGMPILYIGLFIDFVVNVTILSIILLELPREWLVTSRLERHYHTEGWRQKVSVWFAANLLDPFDPSGKHIR